MPFDDLDLEFEDEEEAARKKKSETLHVDVDLEFQAPDPSQKPKVQARPAQAGAAPPSAQPQASAPRPAGAEVRKIDDARAAQSQPQIRRPTPPQQGVPARAQVSGSSALETSFDLESEAIVGMREEMRRVQLESEVKVAVAEFKTEYLTEMLSDMKLLDHQINQLLIRINAKHPDMKQEVLMIKKLLADFNAKKRK